MPIFEVRTYPIKEGKMDAWISFMEGTIAPFITERGMKIDAMFRGVEDPNVFVWIRRFDNETHRQELYTAVYETDHWQSEIKPTVRSLVDIENAVVHVVAATGQSQLQ